MGDPARAYNDNNVYIVGAGFSADAKLPLIRGFMERLRDSAEWLADKGQRRQISAIESVLAFRLKAASAAYRTDIDVENVEELFSLATASSGETTEEQVRLAIAATLDFARKTSAGAKSEVFVDHGFAAPADWKELKSSVSAAGPQGSFELQKYVCSVYDVYVGIMSGWFSRRSPNATDTIISFNYDTLVEESADRLGVNYSYGFSPDSVRFHDSSKARRDSDANALRLLKLHGSVNWSSDFTIYGRYDDVLADGGVPMLAPPTWRKVLGAQLSEVWDAAVLALREATRVVVIGYSIPHTDQHFRYLIAAGLQDNISLRKVLFVNPMASGLADRLFGILRREQIGRQLIELVDQETSLFFKMSPRKIGRDLRRPLHDFLPAVPDDIGKLA